MSSELTTTELPQAGEWESLPEKLSVPTSPALVYLGHLGEGSRRSQAKALENVAELLGWPGGALTFRWEHLRVKHVDTLRTLLKEKYAPATVNKHLAAIRGVLKAAWRDDLISEKDYRKAVDVEGITVTTTLRGRVLPPSEVAALAHVCKIDETARGPRDAALLALGYAGLRRAEIAGLDLDHWKPKEGFVLVHGKGRKDREVPIAGGIVSAVEAWLKVRGDAQGPLLCSIRKGGNITGERLSTQAIYVALARLAGKAGVGAFTPHDLRRTCTSTLLDNGVDLATVADMLGHASTDTTRRYDRANEKRRMQAAEKLIFPY